MGVCNFVYSAEQNKDELDEVNAQMIKFVSSVETIFLDFNLSLKQKKEKLGIINEE